MDDKILCMCKNCNIIVTPYSSSHHVHCNNNIRKYKSGIIIHNPTTNHVLIVQSRGNMWGFPKGSVEQGENFINCAIRELNEETGINIEEKDLDDTNAFRLNHYVNYYYVKTNNAYNTIGINDNEYNDANGICWIKLDCLKELMINNQLKFNYHARSCLFHYFGISKNNINF
jgi:ADP-ribose pyrophosphatase YjhB (NUDIX family)